MAGPIDTNRPASVRHTQSVNLDERTRDAPKVETAPVADATRVPATPELSQARRSVAANDPEAMRAKGKLGAGAAPDADTANMSAEEMMGFLEAAMVSDKPGKVLASRGLSGSSPKKD